MSEPRSFEQALEALRKNPSYTMPPTADQYAYWRMTLFCIATDPEDPPPLDDESVNRIFAAVGHLPIPPELDSDPIFHRLREWLMRQYLIWCPYWYREAAKMSSSKLEKDQIRRLNQVRKAADKLNDLLSDKEGLSLGLAPRVTPMIEAIDRPLAWATDSKGPSALYRHSFREQHVTERSATTGGDRIEIGGGSGGSKSLLHSGTAIIEASAKVVEKGREAASYVLEAAASDIEFAHGRFVIAGTDRSITVMDLARTLREGSTKSSPDAPQSLDVHHISNGPGAATFPNGCHVAEVEVDPETGVAELVKYTCVNDFGIVVNPLIVAGQLHGGVVQGVGQALMEMTVYDSDGQLLTGSFMDYAMPRAADLPSFVLAEHPVPAKTNLLGAKGCGEAGCAGSLTSVMNAVLDALAERGIRHLDMPLTPFRIWQALHDANRAGTPSSPQ